MTNDDKNKFLQAISNEKAYEVVNKVLAFINVEKSECFNKSDRDAIFDMVRRGG